MPFRRPILLPDLQNWLEGQELATSVRSCVSRKAQVEWTILDAVVSRNAVHKRRAAQRTNTPRHWGLTCRGARKGAQETLSHAAVDADRVRRSIGRTHARVNS